MTRRLFTAASVGSLPLCVAVVTLWVRSYVVWDSLCYAHSRWSIEAHSDWGELLLHASAKTDSYMLGKGRDYHSSEAWPAVNGRFMGFGRTWVSIEDHDGKVSGPEPVYYCRYWALLVAFGVMPTIAIARRGRQRRKSRTGACRTCGYDLRASKDRCPECGTPIRAIAGEKMIPGRRNGAEGYDERCG